MSKAALDIALLFPVVILALFSFLPWMLSGDGLLLGIHVTEEFRNSEEGRRLRWRYARDAGVIAVLSIGLAVFSDITSRKWPLLAAVVVGMSGVFVLWIATWKRLHPYRANVSVVRAAELNGEGRGILPWAVTMLAALLPLGAAAIALLLRWQSIPAVFPIHWGVNGQPNGWGERTPAGVFAPLIIGATLILLFAVIGEMIPRVAAGFEGNRSVMHLTRNMLGACGWMVGLLFGAISLMPLMRDSAKAAGWVTMGACLLIGMIVVYMIAGARKIMPALAAAQDSTSDRYWMGGIVYFNPSDPALMVPKRSGLGYTLNMGRPVAWVFVSALVLLPAILPLLLRGGIKH